MKKILFLLLSTVAMYGQVPEDATPLENIQITNNKTSTTATKVNVQENDGTINTISKSDLVNYLEFASAVNLPVTGEQGKLYLTKDNNRLYRFNGTIYQELTTDISGKEDIANKQNSLAVDGTNTKYPTVTAVNTGLALKANLASPALTGTPTAPTATAGTNTTQIATTAFVLANAQSIPQLEFNATDLTVWNNGKGNFSTNTIFGELALKSNTTGSNNTSLGQSTLRDNTIGVSNTAIGSGALGLNTTGSKNVAIGSGAGQNVGHTIVNNSVFLGDTSRPLADNQTNQIVIGQGATGSGSNTATLGNTSITNTILRGEVTTNGSFIKSSAPTTNILLAGGGDIAQNTAFNKPFGITAGTVVEGGTLGSNAYTSTDYVPSAPINSLNTWSGKSGFYGAHYSNVGMPTTSLYWAGIRSSLPNDYTYGFELASPVDTSTDLYLRRFASNSYTPWRKLWHDGNFDPANYLPLSGGTLTGTVTATSYTATSLPVFENNASASSLAVGQFYRTSIGVLMVKF